MEPFAEYGHTIVSIALFALVTSVLSALTGIRKGSKNMTPGQLYTPDYDDPSYRLDRAFMNAAEALPVFATILIAAILAGVSPFMVNFAASVGLVLRLIYTFCYFRRIGAGYGGVRTVLTVLGSVLLYIVAIMTVIAVFTT